MGNVISDVRQRNEEILRAFEEGGEALEEVARRWVSDIVKLHCDYLSIARKVLEVMEVPHLHTALLTSMCSVEAFDFEGEDVWDYLTNVVAAHTISGSCIKHEHDALLEMCAIMPFGPVERRFRDTIEHVMETLPKDRSGVMLLPERWMPKAIEAGMKEPSIKEYCLRGLLGSIDGYLVHSMPEIPPSFEGYYSPNDLLLFLHDEENNLPGQILTAVRSQIIPEGDRVIVETRKDTAEFIFRPDLVTHIRIDDYVPADYCHLDTIDEQLYGEEMADEPQMPNWFKRGDK